MNEEKIGKCLRQVTQIFHIGQPSHGSDRKTFVVMTSATSNMDNLISEIVNVLLLVFILLKYNLQHCGYIFYCSC